MTSSTHERSRRNAGRDCPLPIPLPPERVTPTKRSSAPGPRFHSRICTTNWSTAPGVSSSYSAGCGTPCRLTPCSIRAGASSSSSEPTPTPAAVGRGALGGGVAEFFPEYITAAGVDASLFSCSRPYLDVSTPIDGSRSVHSDTIEIRAGWRGGLSLRLRRRLLLLLRRSKNRCFSNIDPHSCWSHETNHLEPLCSEGFGTIYARAAARVSSFRVTSYASSFSVSGSDIFSHVKRMTVSRAISRRSDPGSEDLIARNRASRGGPVGASNSGQPPQIATADWLEELAVYGTARNLRDQELAYQLSLAIENLYLVRLALRQREEGRREGAFIVEKCVRNRRTGV